MEKTMGILTTALCAVLILVTGCNEVKQDGASSGGGAAGVEDGTSKAKAKSDADMGGDAPAAETAAPGGAAACAPCATQPAAQAQAQTIREFITSSSSIPDVVATIGDKKITKDDVIKDLEEGLKSQLPGFDPGKPLPPRALAGITSNIKNIVDSIVSRDIILRLAKKDGINPSPQLIEKQFDKFVGKMSKDQKDAFEKNLAASGSSIAKKRAEASTDKGAQEMAAINEWIETKVVPTLDVSDATVKKFYDEHKKEFEKPDSISVAHILVRPENLTPDKAKGMSDADKQAFTKDADEKAHKKADKILADVKGGADFAETAKKESACPSAAKGGELPPFDENGVSPMGGVMDKTFTKAALALKKKGDVSGVVKSPYGYHIIKLLNHQEKSCVPLLEVRKKIKKYLESKELEKAIPGLVDQEKKNLDVKILVK